MTIIICTPCNRIFINQNSLEQHYKYSSAHEWCHRCAKAFNSARAKEQHLANSSKHHCCNFCSASSISDGPDFCSLSHLNAHLESIHHHCTTCAIHLLSSARLREHDVYVHNLCVTCGQFFQSPQNLRAHGLTHMPKQIKCFGCDEYFVTTSAMILHLESGYCRCQLDSEEVKQLALESMESGYDDASWREYGPGFRCEGCNSDFSLISALLQHVESNCCDIEGGVNEGVLGQLLEHLEMNI